MRVSEWCFHYLFVIASLNSISPPDDKMEYAIVIQQDIYNCILIINRITNSISSILEEKQNPMKYTLCHSSACDWIWFKSLNMAMRSLLLLIIFLSFNYNCQSQYSIYAKGGASWRNAINLPGEIADFTVQYGNRRYLTRGYTQFSAIGFQYDLVAFDFLDKNWKILSDTEMNYYGRVELLPGLFSVTQSLSIQYNHGKRS